MMKIRSILSLIAIFILLENGHAQLARTGNWCATDEETRNNFQNNDGVDQHGKTIGDHIEDILKNKKTGGDKASPYIIPVVFHCITDNGQGYCSKASVEAQINRLNQDFKRINLDTGNTRAIFKPYAMSMDIEFRLARLDPNGNCTEGIVRVDSPLSTSCLPRDAVKSVSYWDSRRYLNVWVVNSISSSGNGTTLGYAQFPFSGINSTYGVVIDNDYVSSTDRTLTHELGHCFGLLHTFQSGCGGSCSTTGDRVCDTPPSFQNTFGCDQNQNTCTNDASGPSAYGSNVVDQIENYMSYDNCQNMFTNGQKAVMESVLNSTSVTTGLAQLNTPTNHALTGVGNPYVTNPICTPIADFTNDKEYLCEGDSVTFTDISYNATPTSWNWTFTGGTPSSSAVSNPTITYNIPGVYNVTHQPATTAGSGSVTRNNIITVSSLTADYSGAVVDGFEDPVQFSADWRIENPEGQAWQTTSLAAASGSRSARIRNSATTNDDEIDELISPSYDISSVSTKTMTFKQAFVRKNSSNSDRLLVYTSTDCGNTWQLRLPITGLNLATGADQTSAFVPSSSDFVLRTVDLTALANETNVRFRFLFESGGGNDIYLDDINIGGPLGLEGFDNINSLSIYPNPTNSSAQLSFNIVKDVQSLRVVVRDAVGKEITAVINDQPFSVGKYTLKIDEERKLASGLYFIEFSADDNIKIEKLIVQ